MSFMQFVSDALLGDARIKAAFFVSCFLTSICFGKPAPDPESDPSVALRTLRTSHVSGSYIGIGISEIDEERAKALKLHEERGVEVTRVEDETPAAKAGIKTGDIILDLDGQRIEGIEQFVRMLHEVPAGRQIKLTISRNGAPQSIEFRTAVRKNPAVIIHGPEGMRLTMPGFPELPDLPGAPTSWRSAFLGIEGESVNSQLAKYFGAKEGVLVRSVLKSTAADRAGIKAGDVITKVDGAPVTNPREITNALRGAAKKSVSITLIRERREMAVAVPADEDADHIEPRRAVTVKIAEE